MCLLFIAKLTISGDVRKHLSLLFSINCIIFLLLDLFNNICVFFLSQEFVKMLHLKPNEKVLDVGSGFGGSAFHMSQVSLSY